MVAPASSSSVNIGGLVGFLFAFLGGPAALGMLVGVCVSGVDSGLTVLLSVFVVTASLSLLIAWATNWMASNAAARGRTTLWGAAGGVLLATALFATFYITLLTLT